MLCKEIIDAYSENNIKQYKYILWKERGVLTVKTGDTYSKDCALKDY
jgi:hypothetical protein